MRRDEGAFGLPKQSGLQVKAAAWHPYVGPCGGGELSWNPHPRGSGTSASFLQALYARRVRRRGLTVHTAAAAANPLVTKLEGFRSRVGLWRWRWNGNATTLLVRAGCGLGKMCGEHDCCHKTKDQKKDHQIQGGSIPGVFTRPIPQRFTLLRG